MNTFADPLREWNGLETIGSQGKFFSLRLDWIATKEGQRGGMKAQTTEWVPMESEDYEGAKVEAEAAFRNAIPNDRLSPCILQGGVLIETNGRRYTTFTFTR